jgi:hypothetical protein
MKRATGIKLLAALVLGVNYADFATTYIIVTSGKGFEANPLVNLVGGPLSLSGITLKLVVIPALVLGVTWWATRDASNALPGITAILPVAIGLSAAVVNNVLVMTKKVRKTVDRKKKENSTETGPRKETDREA